jgi:hypothetical protein
MQINIELPLLNPCRHSERFVSLVLLVSEAKLEKNLPRISILPETWTRKKHVVGIAPSIITQPLKASDNSFERTHEDDSDLDS